MIESKVGMKVKLVEGTDESVNPRIKGDCTHGLWIAGRIPVGTVGTIIHIPQEPHQIFMKHPPQFAIDFGPEFPARKGYHYGIGDHLHESLEVVKEEGNA